MIYRENLIYPGFGYIEPIMDQDSSLIAKEVAEMIIEHHMNRQAVLNALCDSMRETDLQRFLIDNPDMGKLLDRV
jgi:hypothetical protein